MNRRSRTFILTVLLGTLLSPAALGAGPKLPPAPYKALPVGTVLEYGTWKCTLEAGGRHEQVCRGVGGDRVTFYGKFVAAGRLPKSGYATGLTGIWCLGHNTDSEVEEPFDDVIIDQKARAAIDSLWPLRVGKEVSFRRNFRPTDGKAKSTIRVVGTRTVIVGGVARQVYVLQGKTRKLICSTGPRRGFDEVWWYDPALGAVVHYEIAWVNTRTSEFLDFKYDLVSATVPGARPPMAQKAPVQPPRPVRQAVIAPPQDTAPPNIALPAQISTDSALVALKGTVKDHSEIVELRVNGRPIGIQADGSFAIRRAVPEGGSVLIVTAMDEWGNQARKTIAVTRKAVVVPQVAVLPKPKPKPKIIVNPFADVEFGDYHALVIGNNNYAHLPKLKMAAGDAIAVGDVLKQRYGFEVTTLVNGSRSDIIDALAAMRAKLKFKDNLLIYYAGHGIVDDVIEQGYWLPVDAKANSPSNWISNADISSMLRGIQAKHVMVVSDSCYSGTLVRAVTAKIKTAEARKKWIKRMVGKRSRTALVSGGLEPVLDGGGGGHSVFAKAFLDALNGNKSVMDGAELFDTIKRPVVLNADQTPQYSDIRKAGHDGGEFMFVKR